MDSSKPIPLKHPLNLPHRWTLVRQTRMLTSHRRTARSDRTLAILLAFVAGSANAGGFILLGSYTSHMTGYLSQSADQLVLRNYAMAATAFLAIGLFIFGAALSAIAINWARGYQPRLQYILPLALQGLGFLVFSVIGHMADFGGDNRLVGLGLLCFIMGFQNATITKISQSRIRTTHVTGMITDVGIELGRFVFNDVFERPRIAADAPKLFLLLQLLGMFFFGGVIGAFGYGLIGLGFSTCIGLLLLLTALVPTLFMKREKFVKKGDAPL
jgi:uncharacterized membrane protein YoaK (UPF0700 family)